MRTVLSWDDYQDDVGVVGGLAVEKTGETDRDDTPDALDARIEVAEHYSPAPPRRRLKRHRLNRASSARRRPGSRAR